MAQAIGYVKSFENGTFYVRDVKGNIHQLKAGETINEGDHVYGAYANGADAKIVIDILLDGAGDIVLAGDGALQFDSSLMASIFSQHDAVVHVNSLKEGLVLTAAAEAALQEKLAAADATEAGDETAAGEEVTDTERMADSFDARTGLITDVTTDLRTTAPTRAETSVSEEPVILLEEDNLPLALPDAFTTAEDTPITGVLTDNDIPSIDGGNVWTLTEGAQYGTVVINPDGTFTYTPNANYNGPDSFTYTITDADGDTSTTTVTINVTPVNELSDGNETNTVTEDTILVVDAASGVLANTVNPDGPSNSSVTQFQVAGDGTVYAAGSTATISGVGALTLNNDGSYTFVPAANYAGPIPVITYTVTDGESFDTSTLTLNMIPVNDDEGLSADNINVTEAGLNPAGTAAAGLGEKATGSFTITDPDGLEDIKSVTIGGETFTIGEDGIETLGDIVGKSIDTGYGTVTVTGYSNGTFTYDYVLDVTVDNDSVTGATGILYNEKFTVTVSDGIGDPASKEVTVGITDDAPIFTADYPQNSVIANVGDSDNDADIIATASLGVKIGADLSGATVVITDPTPTEGEINFVTSSNGKYVTSEGQKLAYVSDGNGGLNAVIVTEEDGEYTVTDDVVFSVTPTVATDGSVSYTTTVYDVIDKYTTLSVASESISFDKMSGHYSETGIPATAISENGTITVTFEGYEDFDMDNSIELPSEEAPVQISGQGIGVSSDHIDNPDTYGAGQMLQLTFSQPVMGYMFTADQLDTSDSLVWKAYNSTGGTIYNGTYDGADTGASANADQIVFIGTEAAYNSLSTAQQDAIDYYTLIDGKFDTLQLTADEDTSYRILPEDVTVFYETDVPTLDFAATVVDADGDSLTDIYGDPVSTESFTVTFEGSNVLMGSELSDVLVGSSGSDSLYGAGGNDTLVFDSSDDVIDGGEGTDTLLVAGASALDFSSLDNVSNIEVIDLTDSAGSTLSNVSAADIMEITDAANRIYILGDAADQFGFADNSAWTQTGNDISYDINGTTYQFNQYTSIGDPTVVVHVETELDVLP